MLRYESQWFDSRFKLLLVRVVLWVKRKTELRILHIIHIVIDSVRYRPGRLRSLKIQENFCCTIALAIEPARETGIEFDVIGDVLLQGQHLGEHLRLIFCRLATCLRAFEN